MQFSAIVSMGLMVLNAKSAPLDSLTTQNAKVVIAFELDPQTGRNVDATGPLDRYILFQFSYFFAL